MSRTPLAKWDDNGSDHPALVWWSRLDDRYQVEVHRDSEGHGIFCVFDHEDGDKLLTEQEVPLAYGAVFGPDVDDVGRWQEMAITYVDKLSEEQGAAKGE